MVNSQLQLKDLNEKNAKAVASTVTKYLKDQGITLPHTKALDLAGTICGFADWHGLQAAIYARDAEEANKPIVMSYEDFLQKFKPKKNKIDTNASADGYAFETYGDEFKTVQAAYEANPGTVWTCVEGDGSMWITQGLQHVNRMFYFITNKAAENNRNYEIAYGHDEGDLKFEVSVLNPETDAEEVLDVRYGTSAEDVLDMLSIDYTEEVEGVVEEGETRVIIIKQVS